jgi:RHS repeat-associated protein
MIAGQATQNLVWDESSRLETLTQGTTTTGFLYDADGNRVARRDNGVTSVMIDNTFEWSAAGGLVKYYSHGGQVIAMRNAAGLHWMFGDHLGSASTVRTPAGTNVRQRYLPFGRVRGAAGLPTEYGFTGQRLDPSGLMDYNARQYDPILGRFTSPDTIIPDAADPQSFNRYSYVNNNPVNFTDPTGHRAVPDDCYYGGGCGDSWVGSGKDQGSGSGSSVAGSVVAGATSMLDEVGRKRVHQYTTRGGREAWRWAAGYGWLRRELGIHARFARFLPGVGLTLTGIGFVDEVILSPYQSFRDGQGELRVRMENALFQSFTGYDEWKSRVGGSILGAAALSPAGLLGTFAGGLGGDAGGLWVAEANRVHRDPFNRYRAEGISYALVASVDAAADWSQSVWDRALRQAWSTGEGWP